MPRFKVGRPVRPRRSFAPSALAIGPPRVVERTSQGAKGVIAAIVGLAVPNLAEHDGAAVGRRHIRVRLLHDGAAALIRGRWRQLATLYVNSCLVVAADRLGAIVRGGPSHGFSCGDALAVGLAAVNAAPCKASRAIVESVIGLSFL